MRPSCELTTFASQVSSTVQLRRLTLARCPGDRRGDTYTNAIRQLPTSTHRGVLVSEHDMNVSVAAASHQLRESGSVLREARMRSASISFKGASPKSSTRYPLTFPAWERTVPTARILPLRFGSVRF